MYLRKIKVTFKYRFPYFVSKVDQDLKLQLRRCNKGVVSEFVVHVSFNEVTKIGTLTVLNLVRYCDNTDDIIASLLKLIQEAIEKHGDIDSLYKTCKNCLRTVFNDFRVTLKYDHVTFLTQLIVVAKKPKF